MKSHHKLIVVFTAFIVIMTIGVVGYRQLLHISFTDALYMTVNQK